jgi:fibronectin-binding autotransporter adhesin
VVESSVFARVKRKRWLGCSVAALTAALGGTAYADCLPNPPTTGGTVTCSGATTGGLTVSSYATVNVASGASLTADVGDEAAFTATSTSGAFYGATVYLNVDGAIDGASASGVLVSSGPTAAYPATQLYIKVGQGGSIEGATAVQIVGTPGNTYGRAAASLDNAGLVQSRSGPALVAANPSLTGFTTVNNRTGGYIGGINGIVENLTNAGTIDGGADSAYTYASTNSFGFFPSVITNSGVMRSNGAGATLNLPTGETITNSGQITNGGAGLAIFGGRSLNLTNQAGGVVASTGAVAINAGGLFLVNRGTITGSVVTSGADGWTSSIDSVGGVIQGDLLLGSTDDLLITRWDATTGLVTGVTGRIDGGGGVNTLQLGFSQNGALDTALDQMVMPANFQRLKIQLSDGAAVSLNGDGPDGLRIEGEGSFASNGTVTSQGTALRVGSGFGSGIRFSNTGDIVANFPPPASDPYATAALEISATSFSNTGTITSNGGAGVNASVGYEGFDNAGTIAATATAVNLTFGALNNSGHIRSVEGVGVSTFSATIDNSGTIQGGTVAVLTNNRLVNTGTISAPNGIGVDPGTYGIVDNRADGVITGARSVAFRDYGGGSARVVNAGTLNGDVYLKSAQDFVDQYSSTAYSDKGGTLNGSLTFGIGWDTVVTDLGRFQDGRFAGVTGTVDAGGGSGVDTLLLRLNEDATRTLALPNSFEAFALDLSDNVNVSLTFSSPLTNMLSITGEGKLDLTADITTTNGYLLNFFGPSATSVEAGGFGSPAPSALSVISHGALTVTQSNAYYAADGIVLADQSTFENAGVLTINGYGGGSAPTAIRGSGEVINSGSILLSNAVGLSDTFKLFTNTGVLKQADGGGRSIGVRNVSGVKNTGTIQTQGQAIGLYTFSSSPVTVENSGVISSTGDDAIRTDYAALILTNAAEGAISSATGYAIRTGYGDDQISNAGAITGRIDLGYGADRIENHGTITGDIVQGYGNANIDNYGSIIGNVSLGDGNDTFIQRVGASVTGTVDGGYGLDTLTLDSTNGGSVSASQFVNFEFFSQTGGGSLTYSGAFLGGPIRIDGGGAVVAAGTSVTTPGGVTFSGGALSETITIDGSIAGGVSLGGGVDTVTNRGSIGGSVILGAGDDIYTEGAGAIVGGAIGGGSGADTYVADLAGDRAGLHARSGFETLGVTGSGTLSLTLDQDWNAVSLAGANLSVTSAGHTIGRLSGGDTGEAVGLDVDVAEVNLGGGGDSLLAGFDQLAGAYNGGPGNDTVRFTTTTPVTVAGSLSGFETIALDGGQLAVSGVLGAAGETATFEGDAGQTLSILSGGVLAGTVDLGAGDDLFQLAAGGQLVGTVLGGTGNDKVAIDLASDLSLRGDQLQQFETLQVTGTGALNFTGGAARFDHLVTNSQNLTVATGSSLNAGDLKLDGAANTMTVAGAFSGALDLGAGDDVLRLTTGGTFAGSANGGTGSDRLELALGGTDAAPIALGSTPFAGFETLDLQSGVVSVAGDYGFDAIQVRNGRLIGLAGSRLAASTINVAQGATFGSAGAVTGDITVAGTLSPGASPGTMTVTGDVTMVSGSTALFELTPTVSDQLVVSGTVTIAQGATLKLVGATALTPGRRLDLITAGGGIVGAFSTIDGAQGLNLHIAQSATRLQALGLFTTDTSFSSQVSGVIGVLNTALIEDKVSASLIAALPALADPTTHKSDPRALARVTPQAYASATQLALEDGLTIVDASRAQARFAPDAPGLFGFGQAIDSRRTLDGDAALGVAKGKIDTTGGLAGVGYGVHSAWAGVFVGYLEGRQRIRDLDARTETDSFAIGVQGQVRIGAFQLGAMAAHDGADVDTRRAAPGGTTATGDYKLKSWIADVNLTYRARLNADWAVQPRLGASYVRATRDGFVERGGGAFALTVQGDRSSTWFVDGQVEVLGGQAAGARLHPFASLGFRSTADGGDTTASGVLAGLATPIRVGGLDRGGTLATAGGGAGYDLAPGLTVSATYAGEFGDGGRQAVLVGLNWKF